eukprot:5726272-Amphidinium_carterae.1
MRGVLYFNTFGGGPVCSRVATETLKIIDDEVQPASVFSNKAETYEDKKRPPKATKCTVQTKKITLQF